MPNIVSRLWILQKTKIFLLNFTKHQNVLFQILHKFSYFFLSTILFSEGNWKNFKNHIKWNFCKLSKFWSSFWNLKHSMSILPPRKTSQNITHFIVYTTVRGSKIISGKKQIHFYYIWDNFEWCRKKKGLCFAKPRGVTHGAEALETIYLYFVP